jgi:hypothetical protein
MSGEKMSRENKVVAETKLTEEAKLFEEKKVVDPYVAGFVESMTKTNTEKITKEILEGLSEDTGILVTAIAMMWKVGMNILRIGPGGQVIQSSENQPSNRVILRT